MFTDIPSYASAPLNRCLRSLYKTYQLLDVSMRGISTVSKYPKMVQRLMDLTVEAGQEITNKLKSEREEADKLGSFAEEELRNEFPSLHAFGTVATWSTLEIAIEDMLVGLMLNDPTVLSREEFAKIRIPLAKYEELDKEERMRLLLTELSRSQTGVANGVGTFESVLRIFELSGDVEEGPRRTLWEMNHVRNVIVHRDSHADGRLVQSCPWLGVKIGERVTIGHEKFGAYVDGVRLYVGTLKGRLRKKYVVAAPAAVVQESISFGPEPPVNS